MPALIGVRIRDGLRILGCCPAIRQRRQEKTTEWNLRATKRKAPTASSSEGFDSASCVRMRRLPRDSLIVGLVQPLHGLHRGGDRGITASQGNHGGRREPRRSETAVREAPVEQHVTRGGVDVLNGVLNTATDDRQRVDGASGVDDAARAALGNRSDGSVDLQVVRWTGRCARLTLPLR